MVFRVREKFEVLRPVLSASSCREFGCVVAIVASKARFRFDRTLAKLSVEASTGNTLLLGHGKRLSQNKTITHNRCPASLKAFQAEIPAFLRRTVPQNWATFRDTVTDNFRIRNLTEFRIFQ